jgi:PAS domain S-box-containing protein
LSNGTDIIKRINLIVKDIRKSNFINSDIFDITKKFIEPIKNEGFWLATINSIGEIKKFYDNNIFSKIKKKAYNKYKIEIENYIKNNIFSEETIKINPIIDLFENKINLLKIVSITMRIINKNRTIGFLSIYIENTPENLEKNIINIEFLTNILSAYISEFNQIKKIKTLEERIRQSTDIFNTTLETTENATILIEENSIISFANSEFEKLSEYKKDEIEGHKSLFEFVSKKNLDRMKEYHTLRRKNTTAAPNKYNFNFINKSGKEKNISITIDMVPGTNISIASFLDKTDFKKLESKIIKISEEERQLIGNELHDNLGPHFVGIQFMLKLLREKVNKGILPESSELDEIYNLIDEGISHIRKITKGLKPVDIQPESLMLVITELASQTEKIFNVNCNFLYDNSIYINNNIITTHIYYIIQESINNSIKHADAKNINISIRKNNVAIIIEIEDDGKGISEFNNNNDGMGIDIMRYRANIINASINIFSNKQNGTTIQCIIN